MYQASLPGCLGDGREFRRQDQAEAGRSQRDWRWTKTADDLANLFAGLRGGFGQGLHWEWQLLGLLDGTR